MSWERKPHELWGTVLVPDGIEGLWGLLLDNEETPLTNKSSLNFVWRGQGNDSWGLHSSLVRRIRDSSGRLPPTPAEELVQAYESRLRRKAYDRGLHREIGPDPSDLELFAHLRHYGAATRFLDFSENPMIGLWMAVNDEGAKDSDGTLIGIRKTQALSVRLSAEREIDEGDKKVPVKEARQWPIHELCSDGEFRLWRAELNDRMAAQQGVFLVSRVMKGGSFVPKAHSVMGLNRDSHLEIVLIPSELKDEIQKVLKRNLGYTRTTLFPDLPGFGEAHSASNDFDLLEL